MTQAPATSTQATLPLLEFLFTLIAVGCSFGFPRLFAGSFARIEDLFVRLARRKRLSVALVGLAGLLLRLAILPWIPIPLPFITDDYSFLLSADTFAHGRLTNPTPAMWTHFETIHETMRPTYMSMYFPLQGLVLAAGKVLLGHPWFGLLATSALMCAAICWMLQAWLPPRWALLGGLIAVLHLGLFSYWINSYHSGGSIAGLGGALILGALPRFRKAGGSRCGVLMALGIVLVGFTRPYEGLLLCLPVAGVLGYWAVMGKDRPRPVVLMRRLALPVTLLMAAGAGLGYYDYRAFGHATTLPYSVDRATYAMAPYFVWQQPRPEPAYRHAAMKSFYYTFELDYYNKIHSWKGYPVESLVKALWTLHFYTGMALLPPLFLLWRVVRDRRVRLLAILVAVMIPFMAIQIYLIPHYLAPYTAVFYALGLQAMRHLRQWRPEGKPVGLTMSRLCVTLLLVMCGLRLEAGPLHLHLAEFPVVNWNFMWYGPDHFGTERARVAAELEAMPGKQLVLVRYSDRHNALLEWVYNAADIDGAKVIWARDMDSSNNTELLRYYKDRHVWLVQPDNLPATLTPYPETDLPQAPGNTEFARVGIPTRSGSHD
jgi:hypothetical protein